MFSISEGFHFSLPIFSSYRTIFSKKKYYVQNQSETDARRSCNGWNKEDLIETLKRMKAKTAATKVRMSHVREETTQKVAAIEKMKLELDLLKASLLQYSDKMLLISEVVDN
ncbi:hypothetical protein SLA2020_212520 [Shorea laevis]